MHIKRQLAVLLMAVFLLSSSASAQSAVSDMSDFVDPLAPESTTLSKEEKTSVIDTKIDEYLQKFEESGKSAKEYQKILEPIRQRATTLSAQLQNLDTQMQMSRDELARSRMSIQKKRIDVAGLMQELDSTNAELLVQKRTVADYILLLWNEEQKYRSNGEDGNSMLKLLLADASTFSDAMRPIKYYEVLEQNQRKIFHRLEIANNELLTQQLKLEEEQGRLASLETAQEQQFSQVQAEKEAKDRLMAQTKGMQSRYEALLAESLAQEEESYRIISSLQTNRKEINERLATLSDDAKNRLKERDGNDPYDIERIIGDTGDKPLSWPVTPNSLSAYFMDPNYDKVFHTKHHAIDIPVRQGTPIHAPANGYVMTVKDNGYGYSYIIVAHAGNLASLYGHVSSFAVKEGDLVHRGDIIGYTGGLPGSRGAGVRTTGAHLHFEVHENSTPVDPLKYLPLTADLVARFPAVIQDRVRNGEYK